MAYKNKEDEKAYQRRHYLKHKDLYLAKSKKSNKKYIKRNIEFVSEYKMQHGCLKCGYKEHPSALDFHHIDESKKEFNIGHMIRQAFSIKKIKTEIDKCDVLCANCHRIEHSRESAGIW